MNTVSSFNDDQLIKCVALPKKNSGKLNHSVVCSIDENDADRKSFSWPPLKNLFFSCFQINNCYRFNHSYFCKSEKEKVTEIGKTTLGVDCNKTSEKCSIPTPPLEEFEDFFGYKEEELDEIEEIGGFENNNNFEWNFPTLEELINKFNRHWNDDLKIYEGISFNQFDFNELLQHHNKIFARSVTPNDFGFIEKKDLQEETKIFVRADLHGDLKSLMENMITLQAKGLLDEKFKCLPNVQLVFLGDYEDRGNHTIEVLRLLITLRLENPQQVNLIRGNHENLKMNECMYGRYDKHFKMFIGGCYRLENRKNLSEFYETLPLTVYMSQANGPEGRQYIHFTHGLFELAFDPQELLNSPQSYHYCIVPKVIHISQRIKQIQAKLINGTDYRQLLVNMNDKQERRQIKQKIAAKRIIKLIEQDNHLNGQRDISTYYWGDMTEEEYSYVGDPGARQWGLTVKDVKHYLRLSSLDHRVKRIYRGHQHKIQYFVDSDRIIVTTLSVGMDSIYSKSLPYQPDTVHVLYTAPKVKDWQKQSYLRECGQTTQNVTDRMPIDDTTIYVKNPLSKYKNHLRFS